MLINPQARGRVQTRIEHELSDGTMWSTAMKRRGWKSATCNGKEVTYTCHERSSKSADITAQIVGAEHFHVQLDVPLPITREEIEERFAAVLESDS